MSSSQAARLPRTVRLLAHSTSSQSPSPPHLPKPSPPYSYNNDVECQGYNANATAQQVRLIRPLGRWWGMGLAPSAHRHLVPSEFRRGCEDIHNAPSVAIVWPQPSRAKARRRPPPTRSARWPHWQRWCLRKAEVEHLWLNQAQATGRLLDHFPLW